MADQLDAMFATMDKTDATRAPVSPAAPAAPARQPDAVDAMFSNMDRATSVVATQNLLAAQGADPDKAAKAAALSRANGMPQPVVEQDLTSFEQQAALAQNVDALDQHPGLASFVADNPLAARMAQDDFAKLGFLEKSWDAIKTGAVGAIKQNELGRLGNLKQIGNATGIATPETDQQVKALGQQIQSQPKLTGGFGFVQQFAGFASGLLDNAMQGAVGGAVAGGAAGAAVGSLAAGVGAAPGAAAGFGTGAVIGFNADMARVAAGNAYLKMDNLRGSDGQALSEPAKQFGALFTGAATYAIGTYAAALESKLFGETADALAARALDQALTKPTFTQALATFGKGVATGSAQGAGIITAIEGSAIIGEELSKALSPGHFDTNAQEIVDRLEEAALSGAALLGALHGTTRGLGLYGDFRAAQRADSNAAMFKNLLDGSAESKLRERDQQAFQEFMAKQTDGTPVENLYVPAEKVRELYQSLNVDHTLADRAQDPLFGFVKDMPQQLDEAAATGGDVVIPAADYLAHLAGTPLADKMLPDLRVGANAMSVNDAKAFNEEYQTRLKEAADVAASAPETANPTQTIYDDVKQQAMAAGRSEVEARHAAAIYASRYAARAERLGVDPLDAYRASGLTITQREAPAEAGSKQFNQATRGSIQLGDSTALISLFKDADHSTLIHETGHLWLDELTRDAGIEGAPEQLKTDMQATMKWLGVESSDQIGVEQHEQFARAVEAYFLEGKAPSRELAGVFSRFKAWLTKIYQNVKNLNTPINDEIRGVFDRLLATDDQIEAAKQDQGLTPAFRSKEEAGMTTAEWKSYTGAIDKANQAAESTMLAKMMVKVRRQRTAEYKEALTAEKEKAAAQVDQRPDIQALTLLTKGKLPDGTAEPGAKLSRGDIEATYGKKGITDLPKGVTAVNGVHPDHVAEMFGFASGDDMVKALTALEQQQREIRLQEGEKRGIRQYLIDKEAGAQMDAKYGDVLDEASMEQEALAAIHSDKQTELLATELRYLKRMGAQALVERGAGRRAVEEVQTGADWNAAETDLVHRMEVAKLKQGSADTTAALREATAITKPMLESVRAYVADLLQYKTTDEIGDFNKYLRDERKAAREVQQAILSKDWNKAAAAKQRQILANILYVKAKEASAEVDKGKAVMTRMAAKKSFGSIAQDYVNQIHDLIARFGFDSGRGEELQRTKGATLEEFVKNKSLEEGIELPVDATLFGTAGGPVGKMTLAEFRKLDLAVRGMREVGQSDKIITVDGVQREFNDVKNQIVDTIRALPEREKSAYLNPKSLPFLEAKKAALYAAGRGTDALLVKMEELFSQLDQRDPHGILSIAVFKRLKDAEHDRNKWSEQSAKNFKEAADAASKGWLKRLRDTVPEDPLLIDPETRRPAKLARKDMLGMMLNWGNEGNRARLADGYKWDQANIKAFFDRNATKDDWDFVQKIWNAFDRYKEPLDALQVRVTGVGLDMVKAEPVDTPHGRYDGGYYPIVEDKSRSYRAETHAEKATEAMFPNGYSRATTPHGNTISRVGGERPISIDLDIAPWKIGQTIHDIAMREALMDADRLLSHPDVKKAMDDVMGPEYRKLMRPWLQTIANSRNIDDAALSTWNRILSTARTNVVMVGIGFRAMTAVKHGTTALSNSIGELGSKWMLAGTKEFYGPGMAEKWEWIKSKSPDMAYRLKHYDQDVGGQYANQFKDSAYTKFQQQAQYFGHITISYLDLGSAAPTWLGAYRKGLAEKMSDADAIYYADQTVRNAHGGTGITDRSAIQNQKGFLQLFTMFYGFFNHIYNRQRLIAIDTSTGISNVKAGEYKQATRDFGRVLARSWFYVAMPAFIEALAHGGPDEDKDEGWAGWAAKAIAAEIPAGVPLMRDVAKAAIEGRHYEMSPVARAVDTVVQSGRDIYQAATGDEAPKDTAKHAVEAAGYLTGLPTAAPFTAGKFIWDYADGSADPQDLSEWIQGLLHGKIKDK